MEKPDYSGCRSVLLFKNQIPGKPNPFTNREGFFIYKMQLGYTGSCFHPKKLKLLSL